VVDISEAVDGDSGAELGSATARGACSGGVTGEAGKGVKGDDGGCSGLVVPAFFAAGLRALVRGGASVCDMALA